MPVNRWNLTVDLSDFWTNRDLTFEEQRDAIVNAIKNSSWDQWTGHPERLTRLLSRLQETGNDGEFDFVFNSLYDLADADRVWIEIR